MPEHWSSCCHGASSPGRRSTDPLQLDKLTSALQLGGGALTGLLSSRKSRNKHYTTPQLLSSFQQLFPLLLTKEGCRDAKKNGAHANIFFLLPLDFS